jgi:hypothetical protein
MFHTFIRMSDNCFPLQWKQSAIFMRYELFHVVLLATRATIPISELFLIVHTNDHAQLLSCAHDKVHSLILYPFSLPKALHSLKLPLPKGRVSTAWESSNPENVSTSSFKFNVSYPPPPHTHTHKHTHIHTFCSVSLP